MVACKTLLLPRFTISACKNVLIPRILNVNCIQTESISNKYSAKLGLPEKPRKPLSPYFRFIAQERPTFTKTFNGHPQHLLKAIAEKWKTLDDEKKNEFRNEYNNEMVDYVKQIIKYEKSLTDEQKELIKNFRKEKKLALEKREHRKKQKLMNKPKKPANVFIRFMAEQTALKDPNEDYMVFRNRISEKWKALPKEEKDEYKKQFDADMEVFRKEIIEWEAEMIRSDNKDLIRTKSLVDSKKHQQKTKS